MIEFFSVMFRAITGMKLTPETVILLGFFFALGWLFGKLTTRIGVIKGIFLAIFGSVALVFLSVAPGVIVFFFIAGVLTNHGPLLARVIYWAQDIADIIYALQYRQAFEDIRAEEARMKEEIRQARAEAYARAHARGDSSTQDRWRKSSWRGQEKSRAGEKEKTGGRAGGQKEPPKGSTGAARPKSPPGDPLRDKHLQVLGLRPGQDYSPEEIKKAYRRRAKETHPDAGGNAQDFMAVRAAWKALSG
jgi:DnaJ-domain-containing protein 1